MKNNHNLIHPETSMEEDLQVEAENGFEMVWAGIKKYRKEDFKQMTRTEFAKEMFVTGVMWFGDYVKGLENMDLGEDGDLNILPDTSEMSCSKCGHKISIEGDFYRRG